MARSSTALDVPAFPTPPAGGCQNALATTPFSTTCHSPKQPSRKPRRCNNMPQPTPRGEGVLATGYRLPPTGSAHPRIPAAPHESNEVVPTSQTRMEIYVTQAS